MTRFLCAMLRILILKAFKMGHNMHYIILKQGTHSSDFFKLQYSFGLQNVILVTFARFFKFEYACFNFGKTHHDFLLLLIKNKTKLCHVHALANHRHLLFLVFDCWTCWWCICVVIGYIYVNVLPLKPSWQQQPLFFKKQGH